jgi:hypothetical protein
LFSYINYLLIFSSKDIKPQKQFIFYQYNTFLEPKMEWMPSKHLSSLWSCCLVQCCWLLLLFSNTRKSNEHKMYMNNYVAKKCSLGDSLLYNFICVDGKPKTVAKIEHSLTTYPVGKWISKIAQKQQLDWTRTRNE